MSATREGVAKGASTSTSTTAPPNRRTTVDVLPEASGVDKIGFPFVVVSLG
jgi:hypothetical protein